jgi:hypothetical protein
MQKCPRSKSDWAYHKLKHIQSCTEPQKEVSFPVYLTCLDEWRVVPVSSKCHSPYMNAKFDDQNVSVCQCVYMCVCVCVCVCVLGTIRQASTGHRETVNCECTCAGIAEARRHAGCR